MNRILLLIFSICLAACSASGPKYTQHYAQANTAAVVYVYRPQRVVNCCVAPAVYINGVENGSLKNGGYLVFELLKGDHTVTVGDGSYGFSAQTVSLSIEPGGVHYLKWVIGSLSQFDVLVIGGIGAAYAQRDYHLFEIPLEHAVNEIKELKLSKS